MSANTKKAWLLLRYFEWEKLDPPIQTSNGMNGFMPVFDTKENLLREFPDAEYMEIERRKKDGES